MCLQHKEIGNLKIYRSTWVEIQVCLQLYGKTINELLGSTWVEIQVCLQH